MDWFRSWHGAPTDPKWLLIARKASVAPGVVSAIVWALFDHASQQAEDRGSVQDFDVETYAAFSGFDEEQIRGVLKALTDKGIIEAGHLLNWKKRQPAKEDPTASKRKRRQRENENMSRDVTLCHDSVTPSHAPEKSREDTEEKRKTDIGAVADATPAADALKVAENLVIAPLAFDEFWKTYPKRQGANPREPARKAFVAALKAGALPEAIMGGAERYASELRRDGKLGTQFVARALTWIHERRWQDYPPSAEPEPLPGCYARAESDELAAWDEYGKASRGRGYPRDKNGGWQFPTQWPPGHPTGPGVSNAA